MEILIDIDENLYTRLFDNGIDNYDDAVDMAKAIRKGTPLPKGHGRLVDLDNIEEQLERYGKKSVYYQLPYSPTIIEADKESEK